MLAGSRSPLLVASRWGFVPNGPPLGNVADPMPTLKPALGAHPALPVPAADKDAAAVHTAGALVVEAVHHSTVRREWKGASFGPRDMRNTIETHGE